MRQIGKYLLEHRRRFAPLVAVAGALLVGRECYSAAPMPTDLLFEFGPAYKQVREARFAYFREGEPVRGNHFNYPDGAPRRQPLSVELLAGTYDIVVDLKTTEGDRSVRRSLDVPSMGTVTIRLTEQ